MILLTSFTNKHVSQSISGRQYSQRFVYKHTPRTVAERTH